MTAILEYLGRDELEKIYANLHKSYHFVLRMTCKNLRDAFKGNRTKTRLTAMAQTLPLMKWAVNLGCPWTVFTCRAAAYTGNLEVLKWLQSFDYKTRCRWDDSTATTAALHGHTKLLEWALVNGAPDPGNASLAFFASEGADLNTMAFVKRRVQRLSSPGRLLKIPRWCAGAAAGGHLSLLQDLRHCKYTWDEDTTYWAARNGHVDVLDWAMENGCAASTYMYDVAAEFGRLNVIKYLHGKGYQYHGAELELAAKHDQLECFLYMWERRNENDNLWYSDGDGVGSTYTWDEIMHAAGRCVSKERKVLTWMVEKGWNLEDTQNMACEGAAYMGSIETLSWLRSRGFGWDEHATAAAAAENHLDCLVWLHEHECPMAPNLVLHAAKPGHFEIVKWAVASGAPWHRNVCFLVAKQGNVTFLRWAREHGCPWDVNAVRNAVQHNVLPIRVRKETLRWIDEEGGTVSGDS